MQPDKQPDTKPDKAVLFDLDGTLVDTERENVESVVLAARRWKLELDADMRKFIVGHSWNEIHARMQRDLGLQVSMDVLIAAAVEEKRALFANKGYRALPGAIALVRRLRQRALLAVVSGASCVEVRESIAGVGLAEYFQVLTRRRRLPHRQTQPRALPNRHAPARRNAACVHRHRRRRARYLGRQGIRRSGHRRPRGEFSRLRSVGRRRGRGYPGKCD